MDQDVGPSMSDNSGKYFDESKVFSQAMDMVEKAIASAEKVKYDKV
jgi:hypothetical protein